MSETSIISNNEVDKYYLNGRIPDEIADNIQEFFPEYNDLSHEEVLILQESVYRSIQANEKNKAVPSEAGQTSKNQHPTQEGECSYGISIGNHVAFDEDFARSLELGEEFEGLCISESSDSVPASSGSRESTPSANSSRVVSRTVSQDDIDPDDMTYEELQSFGEAVGHQNRGLSEDFISRLPTFKFKRTKFFSNQRDPEKCVICFEEFKTGTQLTALPCTHQYHSECITPWLKDNKSCPICQKEVEDE